MDSVKSEKIHAIKKFKRNQLLKNLFLYSFSVLACLVYSSPFWYPYVSSSVEAVLQIYVPKLSSVLFNSKFVFIVGNIIIVALIGESKVFSSGSSSTPSHESSYYEEYINSRQNLQRFSVTNDHRKKEKPMCSVVEKKIARVCEDHVNKVDYKDGESRVVDEKRVVGFVVKKLEAFGESCNEIVLPTEELKKRADDFIARVNKRRVFEARELLCDSIYT